eukprot:c10302_g1_i3.p2 GENE.c10302_g1_i3~~c10302_g1_i3.p2  ORF type:complete len:103 (+),score=8.63 c10302_g1_i3:492-800(+)
MLALGIDFRSNGDLGSLMETWKEKKKQSEKDRNIRRSSTATSAPPTMFLAPGKKISAELPPVKKHSSFFSVARVRPPRPRPASRGADDEEDESVASVNPYDT